MKAERRHELKHNELSDWLGQRVETMQPHMTGIVIGLGILLVLVLGGTYYFGSENTSAANAWSDYFAAFNEREPQKGLETVSQEHLGSKAAWWALAAVGDMNLGQGAGLLYSDRAEAKKHLDQAEAAYKRVESFHDPMLKARAQLGLGKVYESLCKPEEASKYYEIVAKSQKGTAIGKSAAADLERMKNPREVAFLEWFAQQTPKRPAPLSGVGANVPGLPGNLSSRPDMELPSTLSLDGLGGGVPPGPATTFPAPGGAFAPVNETTDDAAKAADAPKTDAAQPATTSPATPAGAANDAKAPAADAGDKKPD